LALAAGVATEWIADNVTRRMPVATAEGVRLALRSAPFDSSKARAELGYAPRPIADGSPPSAPAFGISSSSRASHSATVRHKNSAVISIGSPSSPK
jgi:hypothetical protein